MPNNLICIHLYTTCIIYFSVKAAKDESPLLRGPAHADAKRAELSISQPMNTEGRLNLILDITVVHQNF